MKFALVEGVRRMPKPGLFGACPVYGHPMIQYGALGLIDSMLTNGFKLASAHSVAHLAPSPVKTFLARCDRLCDQTRQEWKGKERAGMYRLNGTRQDLDSTH